MLMPFGSFNVSESKRQTSQEFLNKRILSYRHPVAFGNFDAVCSSPRGSGLGRRPTSCLRCRRRLPCVRPQTHLVPYFRSERDCDCSSLWFLKSDGRV